jgi:hypothetical protein
MWRFAEDQYALELTCVVGQVFSLLGAPLSGRKMEASAPYRARKLSGIGLNPDPSRGIVVS